jgi:hypothetical protein
MVQAVLTVGGAFVGGMFGVPQLGAALGSLAGAALTPAEQIDGPRLGSLKAPEIQYGAKVPRVYGTVWRTATPLWWTGLRDTPTTQGGKGGGPEVTTHSYSADLLVLLADGSNVIGYTRIEIDGQVVETRLAASSTASLTSSLSADYYDDAQLFTGGATQAPWSVMEAAVGTTNAIAYRDQCTMGFTNLRWRNGRQPSVIRVEVVTSADTAIVESDVATASPGGAYFAYSGATRVNDRMQFMVGMWTSASYADRSFVMVKETDTGFEISTTAGVDTSSSDAVGAVSGTSDVPSMLLRIGSPERFVFHSETLSTIFPSLFTVNTAHYSKHGTSLYIAGQDINVVRLYSIDGVLQTTSAALPTTTLTMASDSSYLYALSLDGGTLYVLNATTLALTSTLSAPAGADGDAAMIVESDGLYYVGHSALYQLVGSAWVLRMSGLNNSRAGNLSTAKYAHSFDGTKLKTVHLALSTASQPATFVLTIAAPSLAPTLVPLQQVLEAEILRCTPLTSGDIDMSAAAGKFVRGYEASGSGARSIGPLLDWYFLELFCDDKLRLVARGGSVEQTIDNSFTGIGNQVKEPFAGLLRVNDVEVQKFTQVQYINSLADGEIGTEDGGRIAAGTTINTVQFNLYALPTEAKGRAITFTRDARVAAHTATISVSARHGAFVQPGSVLSVVDNKGITYRLRVLKLTWDRHVYSCEVALDDTSVLVSSAITSEAGYSPVIELPLSITATFLALDAPPLPGADATPGYLGLVKTSAVASATWFSSVDNVTFIPGPSFINDAVFGAVTAVSGTLTSDGFFNESAVITVNVGDGTLTSSTRDALLADRSTNAILLGVNGRLVAGQYRTATQTGAGVYQLTGLLLGQQGTEQYVSAITTGDKFALLGTAGTAEITRSTAQIGVQINVKAVVAGRALNNVQSLAFTPNAENMKPRSPVQLRAVRNASSGDVTFTFNRRTRLQTRFGGPLGDSTPVGEDTESYRVRIYTSNTYTTVARDIGTITAPTFNYTGAQQTTDFGSNQNTVYVGITQVSAVVGEGYPLKAAA